MDDDNHGRTLFDEVQRIGRDDCRFTTFLDTRATNSSVNTVPKTDFFDASVFVAQSSPASLSTLDVLSLELELAAGAASNDQGNPKVSIYAMEGDFRLASASAEGWETLAVDASTHFDPISQCWIVPVQSMETKLTIRPNRVYSIYVAVSRAVDNRLQMALHSFPSPGDVWHADDHLQIYDGYGINNDDDEPAATATAFPHQGTTAVSQPASIRGKFHYRLQSTPCDAVRISTSVRWEFAFSKEDADAVPELLQLAVQNAISAVTVLNPDLIRYAKNHGLEQEQGGHVDDGDNDDEDHSISVIVESQEESTLDSCPSTISDCLVATARTSYLHAVSLLPGDLVYAFLQEKDTIVQSVEASLFSDSVLSQYIEQSLNVGKFVVTLVGVPASSQQLNPLQRRYVERIITELLQDSAPSSFANTMSDFAVLKASITDEVFVASQQRNLQRAPNAKRSNVRRRSRGEHHDTRLLQDADADAASMPALQLGIDVIAQADATDLRSIVLETFDRDPALLKAMMMNEWRRPNEIGDFGSYFQELREVTVGLQPSGFGDTGPPNQPVIGENGASEGGDGLGQQDILRISSIVGVVVGALWLAVVIWRDCLADFLRAHRILPSENGKHIKLNDIGTSSAATPDDDDAAATQQRDVESKSLSVLPSLTTDKQERRTSFDGAQSLDGTATSKPPLSCKSDHPVRTKRPKSMGNLGTYLSEHIPRQSATSSVPRARAGPNGRGNLRPARSMDDATRLKMAKSASIAASKSAARNRAGENGRGNLRASRSMDFVPRKPSSLRSSQGQQPHNRSGERGRGNLRPTRSMDLPPRSMRSTGSFERRTAPQRSKSTTTNKDSQVKQVPHKRIIRSTRSLPMPTFSSSTGAHDVDSSSSFDSDDSDLDSENEFAIGSNHAYNGIQSSSTNKTKAELRSKSKSNPTPSQNKNDAEAGPEQTSLPAKRAKKGGTSKKKKNRVDPANSGGGKKKKRKGKVVSASVAKKKNVTKKKSNHQSPTRIKSSDKAEEPPKKAQSLDDIYEGAKRKTPKRNKSTSDMPPPKPPKRKTQNKKKGGSAKKSQQGVSSSASAEASATNATVQRIPSKASQMDRAAAATKAAALQTNLKSNKKCKVKKRRERSNEMAPRHAKGDSAEESASEKGDKKQHECTSSTSTLSFGAVNSKNFDPEFMSKDDMEQYLESPKFEKDVLPVIPLDAEDGTDVLQTMRVMKYLDRPTNTSANKSTKTKVTAQQKSQSQLETPSARFGGNRMPPGRSKSAGYQRKPPSKTRSMDYGKRGRIKFERRFSDESKFNSADVTEPDSSNVDNGDASESDESGVYEQPPSIRKNSKGKSKAMGMETKRQKGRKH
mmetsp:Transcript_2718/g.7541  ORF Transcript_2718/g.7541 Transcript_2718/m.7541 type:complete len:1349 (+) Transcript_2718:283-4329(+)